MSQLIRELPLKTFDPALCPLHGEGSYVAIAWTQFHQIPVWNCPIYPHVMGGKYHLDFVQFPAESGAFGLQERLFARPAFEEGQSSQLSRQGRESRDLFGRKETLRHLQEWKILLYPFDIDPNLPLSSHSDQCDVVGMRQIKLDPGFAEHRRQHGFAVRFS